MADSITVTDLESAKLNVVTIDEIATSFLDTTTDRLGNTKNTLNGALKLLGYKPPIVYAGAILFAVNDNTKTVDEAGVIYAPLPSELPFTTSGTFVGDDDSRFFVAQGVTRFNLPSLTNINFKTVALMVADTALEEGTSVTIESYTSTNNSGVMDGVVVAGGSGTNDGFKYFNIANGLQVKQTLSGYMEVEKAGAEGDGITDDSSKVTTMQSVGVSPVFKGGTTYIIANVDILPFSTIKSTGTTTIKKGSNGYIFDLGEHSEISGKFIFDGDALGGLTGNSIVISKGDNTPVLDDQGLQKISRIIFENSESYHVAYTVANKGWQSRISYCEFNDIPTNAPAMVLWPDETANGGNRYVSNCYSAGPIVNVNGCDNGGVFDNVIGASTPSNNQGLYFDATAVNPPKKIIASGNRFAYAGKQMNIRGTEHVFSTNIFAGGVIFEAGAELNVFSSNNIFASGFGVISNNGLLNYIFDSDVVLYTPGVVSGVTLGNGSLAGEYKRIGSSVDFRLEFVLGSTTVITGTITFDLPVAPVSGVTSVYLGGAWGDSHTGTSYLETGSNRVSVYRNSETIGVWDATIPKAWATGDKIVITGTYRL